MYLSYETIKFIISFTKFIDDAYDQVYASAYAFLRTGLERYFMMFKYEPSTSELNSYYSRLTSVGDTVNELVFAIKLGTIVGMTLATTAVLINVLWLLYDFRKRMMDARKGKFDFYKDKIAISLSAGLAGGIISNSIFLFFI